MNIWKEVKYSGWRHPIHNVSVFFKKLKYIYQRATKGYCDYDLYQFDTYISSIICDGVRKIAGDGYGYPGHGACHNRFDTPEKWNSYLLELADNFALYNATIKNKYELAREYTINNKLDIPEEKRNKILQCFLEEEVRIDKIRQASLKRGLEMLDDEVFRHLYE